MIWSFFYQKLPNLVTFWSPLARAFQCDPNCKSRLKLLTFWASFKIAPILRLCAKTIFRTFKKFKLVYALLNMKPYALNLQLQNCLLHFILTFNIWNGPLGDVAQNLGDFLVNRVTLPTSFDTSKVSVSGYSKYTLVVTSLQCDQI